MGYNPGGWGRRPQPLGACVGLGAEPLAVGDFSTKIKLAEKG